MSLTIPILLAVVAAGWFVLASTSGKVIPGVGRLGLVGGILALVMAATVLAVEAAKITIAAPIVIPLLVATIVEFGFIIVLVSRLLSGRISQRGFLIGVLTIIGAILVGVVLMFQPATPTVFNLGFDFVLIALLVFNVWSHITPRPGASKN